MDIYLVVADDFFKLMQCLSNRCDNSMTFCNINIVFVDSSAIKIYRLFGGELVVTDHPNGARVAAKSRLAASIGPNPPLSYSNKMFVGCCCIHLFLNALHVFVELHDGSECCNLYSTMILR